MNKKINIYSLSDSITGRIFYIGATYKPLNERLTLHLSSAKIIQPYKKGFIKARNEHILSVLKSGGEIDIHLLKIVTFNKVNYWEHWFYAYYLKLGYNLLQTNYQFVYGKRWS